MYLSEADEGQVLLVNKPLGWTSFDVIKKLRQVLKVKKIGHAGTLDPLATGLLIICTGRQTKNVTYYQSLNKVYTGELVLGKTTPSFDLETPFDQVRPWEHLTEEAVYKAATTFLGDIQQVPPIYSAVRVNGTRSYEKARQGQLLTLTPRPVFIQAFKLTSLLLPLVRFELCCSKGTYVRSLVHDLGERLGTGSYLSKLCRTAIGPYLLQDAHTIDSILLK